MVSRVSEAKVQTENQGQSATMAQPWLRGIEPDKTATSSSSVSSPTLPGRPDKIDWEQVQCRNVVPGYTGYIPAKYAQSR